MIVTMPPDELRRILTESVGGNPYPLIHDESVRQRAIEQARRQGLLEQLEHDPDVAEPIRALPYNLYREYRHKGIRVNADAFMHRHTRRIASAALACWLGIDRIAHLEELIWSQCEWSWWMLPSHERNGRPRIDLRVAMTSWQLAMVAEMFKDRLAPEVVERVGGEIARRAIGPFLEDKHDLWWKINTNNWNAVCHGGVCIAAMLTERDPARLTAILAESMENLQAFLDGFTEDGGCTEGPSYWAYGFGWYVRLAHALYDFTGGRLNIMQGRKIEQICRYILAVSITDDQQLPFADSHHIRLPVEMAVAINRFVAVPELYALCPRNGDGSLRVHTLEALLAYEGEPSRPAHRLADSHLDCLGVAKLSGGGVTVGAKAGHNEEHHNHNDVGAFVVHRGHTFFVTDPGAPVYSSRTFSERRYESVYTSSRGHSVPVVAGQLQSPGKRFSGSLTVEGLGGQGAKVIRIEMAGAYDVAALSALTRTITLEPDGRIELADRVVWSSAPGQIEDVFITTLPAAVCADGSAVRIDGGGDGVAELKSIDTPGQFRVEDMPESLEESRSGALLRRIVFAPAGRDSCQTLRLGLTFLQ